MTACVTKHLTQHLGQLICYVFKFQHNERNNYFVIGRKTIAKTFWRDQYLLLFINKKTQLHSFSKFCHAVNSSIVASGYNSDILCLQEVDQKVMDNDLDPVLRNLGYEGFLRVKRRTSSQGIATFYRKDKFK